MTKFNTCTRAESGSLITPAVRLLYPALFKPTQVKGQGAFKYRVTGLVPKDADISMLIEDIEKLITENLPGAKRKTTKFRYPLIKTEDEAKFAEYADDYPWMIRPNADDRPGVVGPTVQTIAEDQEADEVYGGRWARISLNAYWYPAVKSPIPGVGLGLNNVQLLDHDEPINAKRVAPEREFESAGSELDDLE